MKNALIILAIIVVAVVAFQQFNAAPQNSNNINNETSDASSSLSSDDAAVDTNSATAALISAAADGAAVFFIEPADGAVVSSPVNVKFGVTNMEIVPAGTDKEFSGHHHILIDLDTLPDMSLPLPATDQVVHFGGGQTETDLELSPGEHTLQLLLGNYLHIPHDTPVISEKITITVE